MSSISTARFAARFQLFFVKETPRSVAHHTETKEPNTSKNEVRFGKSFRKNRETDVKWMLKGVRSPRSGHQRISGTLSPPSALPPLLSPICPAGPKILEDIDVTRLFPPCYRLRQGGERPGYPLMTPQSSISYKSHNKMHIVFRR